MDVLDAIRTRRSIRAFRPDRPPRHLIEAVILDAALAPPPVAGLVPWTFHVLDDPARIARCEARALEHVRRNRPEGPGWASLDREGFRMFWGAPVVVVICGPVEDCVRAGQVLLLAALERGLGTCWVGAPLPWLASAEGRAELGLGPDESPVSAICLGYPAEVPPPKPPRRPPLVWCDPA
jgi:nitroreductase